MKNTIVLLFLCLTQLAWAGTQDSLETKFLNYKSAHQQTSSTVTDSAINLFDYARVLQLHSNNYGESCPEFGVKGKEYHRVLIKLALVKNMSSNKSLKVKGWFLENIDTIPFNGQMKLEKISTYKDKYTEREMWLIKSCFQYKLGNGEKLKGNTYLAIAPSQLMDTSNQYLSYEEGEYKVSFAKKIKAKNSSLVYTWGLKRYPSSIFPGFDVGGGELQIHYKYLKNGWSTTFDPTAYIKKQVEDIPSSDYSYYGIKNLQDAINNWSALEKKLGMSPYSEGIGKIDVGCQ